MSGLHNNIGITQFNILLILHRKEAPGFNLCWSKFNSVFLEFWGSDSCYWSGSVIKSKKPDISSKMDHHILQ